MERIDGHYRQSASISMQKAFIKNSMHVVMLMYDQKYNYFSGTEFIHYLEMLFTNKQCSSYYFFICIIYFQILFENSIQPFKCLKYTCLWRADGTNGHALRGHWKRPQSINITVNSLIFFPYKNPCRKGKAVHDGNTNKYCRKTAVGAENLNALL